VGRGQLHWKLRNDKRVVLMEGINARYLNAGDFQPRPGFATLDASFISLTKLLPAVTHVLASKARIVTLIKPQFEAGKEQVERGGVVRDPEIHQVVINRIRQFGEQEQGLIWLDMCTSPLRGPAGNIEFLSYWEKPE
jgi:23S rRNA (cytidine1920-2'-O)/16S rRNA (cytidine1409-2'-O)-methyltransferase